MKLGVFMPCLRPQSLEEALEVARDIGLEGMQLWNVGGPYDPSALDADARKALRDKFASYGLEISALCAHNDYCNPAGLAERVAHFKACMRLAADLGAVGVTTESGRPAPETGEDVAWQILVVTFREICAVGEEVGVKACIEAGPTKLVHTIADLERLIEEVDSPAMAVNLDPANLVMAGEDPVEAVRRLGDRIVHTHAKDGVLRPDGSRQEVPLGEGQVPWPEYLAALKQIGYQGYLCIEREVGDNPRADIELAAERLRQWLAAL